MHRKVQGVSSVSFLCKYGAWTLLLRVWGVDFDVATVCVECYKGLNMKVNAAFIFIAPNADSAIHRSVIDSPVVCLTVVGVGSMNEAESVAVKLASEGVTALELCAGFGNEGTARIAKAVRGKAIVGAVRFDLHPGFDHRSGDEVFH